MDTGNYNIADLTQVVYNAMSGVSANIFTDRPATTPVEMTDFIVTKFPTSVYNRLGTGNTSCRISLYARDDVRNNITYENISKLKTMQNAVYAKLPITNAKCIIGNPIAINAGSDKLGFHCIHINCDVTII